LKVRNIIVWLALGWLLTACAEGGGNKAFDLADLIKRGTESFQVMNSYAVIENDFERGHIMRARERALEMKASDSDYARVQKLLKEKIEPARRRIFVHYLRLAKKHEARQNWSDAGLAYEQAKAITLKPDAMEAKRWAMEKRLRQLRVEKLIRQRRREDRTLLSYGPAYEAARGLSPRDEVYLRQQEYYNDDLDDRATRAYRESRHYLRQKKYGPAYIEIESYLRLQPGSTRGLKQLAAIKRELPTWLKIPPMQAAGGPVGKPSVARLATPKEVTLKQVQEALSKGELSEAKHLAQIYRRNGGQGAAKLLAQIQQKLNVKSDALFIQGSAAFRKEKLDLAIRHWSRAVALTPEKSEYVEALNRARQLKERLNLLRSQKDSDPIPEEE